MLQPMYNTLNGADTDRRGSSPGDCLWNSLHVWVTAQRNQGCSLWSSLQSYQEFVAQLLCMPRPVQSDPGSLHTQPGFPDSKRSFLDSISIFRTH